ncbi:MAG: DUF2062 domain-containing protein [Alphaproteobacteria bacterium]
MLFKRRNKIGFWERLRVVLWPRVSWRRSGAYFAKRVLRLSAAPHAVALGCAIGAAVSTTPFLGLHLVITAGIAWLLRGNIIAGAIGTSVGNPLTFPFVWALTHRIGVFVLGGRSGSGPPDLERQVLENSFGQIWPVIKPMMVGALPVGLLVGIIMYAVTYFAVTTYQQSRRARFTSRRAVMRATAMMRKKKAKKEGSVDLNHQGR